LSENASSFNEQAALARVAGDRDLLREIAGIYVDSYQKMVDDVSRAVADGDAEKLRSSAHLLKGTVANFDAHAATSAAADLERMGRENALSGAPERLEELVRECSALADALDAYRTA